MFSGCTRLASITVDPNNPNYSSESGILYNKEKTELIAWPSASGNITTPAGVTSIGYGAFSGCTGITGITILEGVTTIGEYAFSGYSDNNGNVIRIPINSITIPASVTSIGQYVFSYWNEGQTINIQGYSNEDEANAAWGYGWQYNCGANIRYWNGNAWQ